MYRVYCSSEPSLVDNKEEQLKKELARIPGESIVVVQDEDIVKVHVHTLKPGNALNIAQRFGEFVKLKIENMQEQADTIQSNAGNDCRAMTMLNQNVKLKKQQLSLFVQVMV